MKLRLIVAAAENNVIGLDGAMPWQQRADLKHFKNITWGGAVLMGRKTYESLGKILPGRKNIVLSRQHLVSDQVDLHYVLSLDDAIHVAMSMGYAELNIIGGGEIYKQSFPMASTVFLTRIHASPKGDTYFPQMDFNHWELKHSTRYEKDDKNTYDYSFEEWVRKYPN